MTQWQIFTQFLRKISRKFNIATCSKRAVVIYLPLRISLDRYAQAKLKMGLGIFSNKIESREKLTKDILEVGKRIDAKVYLDKSKQNQYKEDIDITFEYKNQKDYFILGIHTENDIRKTASLLNLSIGEYLPIVGTNNDYYVKLMYDFTIEYLKLNSHHLISINGEYFYSSDYIHKLQNEKGYYEDWCREDIYDELTKELIRQNPFEVINGEEFIDNNFFDRLIRYEKSFKKLLETEQDAKYNFEIIQSLNEIIQIKHLSTWDIKQIIKQYNEMVSEVKYYSKPWLNFVLHLRHLAMIYRIELKLDENTKLIEI